MNPEALSTRAALTVVLAVDSDGPNVYGAERSRPGPERGRRGRVEEREGGERQTDHADRDLHSGCQRQSMTASELTPPFSKQRSHLRYRTFALLY